MRLLLDTHTLIWHFDDNASLSPSVKRSINDPENELFISVASVWELSLKTSLGKLRIEIPIHDLITGYIQTGTSLLSITLEHAIKTASLPWHHRDPFDRMLIAQAQLEGLTIATCDDLVRQYNVPHIW